MKTQYVSALQEGDMVNDYFLATRKDLRTQSNGGKFLGMVFRDRTAEIGGILWNNAASVAQLFEVGDVVNVRGTVGSYQGRLQVRVDEVLPLKEDEYERNELVAAGCDADEMLETLQKHLGTVQNQWLRQLIDRFWADEGFMARFRNASAGKRWHHAYPGGLARHCAEMMEIASVVCRLFPAADHDLLLTGVFLHDIGKLEELDGDLMVDYTTAGKLLGHLEIGTDMVRRAMASIDGFPETLRLHLLHLMLSHHGELVNGSPVVPKTLEAMILYHCDNLDAQADALSRITLETKERGETWSEMVPLLSRQVWSREI